MSVVADHQAISCISADYGTVSLDSNSASIRKKKMYIGLCGKDDKGGRDGRFQGRRSGEKKSSSSVYCWLSWVNVRKDFVGGFSNIG